MKKLSLYILTSTFILASCGGGGGGGGSAPSTPTTPPAPTTYTFDARNFITSSQLEVIGHFFVRDFTNEFDCVNTFQATLVKSSNTEIYFQNFNLIESRVMTTYDPDSEDRDDESEDGGQIQDGVHVSEDYSSYNVAASLYDNSGVSGSNNITFYSYSGTTQPSDLPYEDRSANLSLDFASGELDRDSCLLDMRISLLAAGTSPVHTLYGTGNTSHGERTFLVMFPKSDIDSFAGDAVKEADIFHDGFPGWAGFQSYHSHGSKPTISFNGDSSTLDDAFDAYNSLNGYTRWSGEDIFYYGSPIYDVTFRNLTDGSYDQTGFSKFLSKNGGIQNMFLIGSESPSNDSNYGPCIGYTSSTCDAKTYLLLFMYGDKKRLLGFNPEDYSAWFFAKAE